MLKIHAQLKRDIIYETETETVIYKRDDDGSLTRVEARRQREAVIVGSYAWESATWDDSSVEVSAHQ